MPPGLRQVDGNPAAPPYSNGPYTMDQHITFTGGIGVPNGEGAVWFVDGTNGNAGNNGRSWSSAFVTVQAAIDAAGPGDTIYVTAKDITDQTGDPASYEENLIIPNTASSLSIIGVSRGRTQGGLPQFKDGAGTTAQPETEDGSYWHTGRRYCARFQQYSGCDARLLGIVT